MPRPHAKLANLAAPHFNPLHQCATFSVCSPGKKKPKDTFTVCLINKTVSQRREHTHTILFCARARIHRSSQRENKLINLAEAAQPPLTINQTVCIHTIGRPLNLALAPVDSHTQLMMALFSLLCV